MEIPLWTWILFVGIVLVGLVVDLLSHRGSHGSSRKAAIAWTVTWILLAAAFGVWVGLQFGAAAGRDFATAYLIEKSLSVDNLFVFVVVFHRLKVPAPEQHRVLFWGIVGALVARALFIASGTALLARWHWLVYVLGAFLIFTGWKTFRARATENKESRILQFAQRHLGYTARLDGHRFFTREAGRRVATPLLLALITIELTDILFAIDSIPAVFAVSTDPFIVYSSNVFAILGLRALYVLLAGLLKDLRYLHVGLAAILVLAGLKMILSDHVDVPHVWSLIAVVGVLGLAVGASLLARRRRTSREARDLHPATSTPGT